MRELKSSMNISSAYGLDTNKQKQRHKQYKEKHKEEKKEIQSDYYIMHRDELLEKQRVRGKSYYEKNKEKYLTKYVCECGCTISNMEKTRHLKTIKHKNLMNTQSNLNIPISLSVI